MLLRLTCASLLVLWARRSQCGEPDRAALTSRADGAGSSLVVRMPAYQPQKNDDYVCHAMKVPSPLYITAFWPTAHADRVHHMLLFGCESPLQPDNDGVWPCFSGCGMGANKMLYAWARNAPELVLPDGVSFAVGGDDTKIYYLVLQVHYAQPFEGVVWDMGGVKMDVTSTPTPNLAAIYLFYGQTRIPPQQEAYFMNMTCSYDSDTPVHPFAYRTHAHGLGRMISAAYRRDGQWTKIGKRNPQWPQMFEKIKDDITIKKGDEMAAMCRYDSSGLDKETRIGHTGADEMCNFYMMYWRDASLPEPFRRDGCGEVIDDKERRAVMDTYPEELTTLLPVDDELEKIAHQSGIKFGSKRDDNVHLRRRRRQINDYPGVYFNRRRPPVFGGGGFPPADDGGYERPRQLTDTDDYADGVDRGDGGIGGGYDRRPQGHRGRTTGPKADSRVMPVAQQPAAVCDDCVVERAKWTQIGSTSLGQVSGVAVDPMTGHLLIFHRGRRSWDANAFDASNRLTDRSAIGENTVLEVDVGAEAKSSPKLLKSWGADLFYMPHAIHADGRGAVWTTDVGSHQVIKWTLDTGSNYQSSITLGTKFEPGDDRTHFCKPAGVVTTPDGSVFIADGYCNARVIKFDSNGNYVDQFGSASPPGKTPAPLGTFSLPHDVSLDATGKRLYVADRQNGRVQVFSMDDYKPLGEIKPTDEFETVYAVDYSSAGKAVFFVPGEPSTKADSKLKAFAANPTTRQLLYAWTSGVGDLERPHSIKASPDGRYVYVGEITQPKGAVRKFEVLRQKSQVAVGHNHPGGHHEQHNAADGHKQTHDGGPKPLDASEGDSVLSAVAGGGPNWVLGVLVVLVAPLLIAGLACFCVRRRRRGSWRDDLRINRPLLNRTDRKGFRPLATDDAEGLDLSSDESENEDTLYKADMQKP